MPDDLTIERAEAEIANAIYDAGGQAVQTDGREQIRQWLQLPNVRRNYEQPGSATLHRLLCRRIRQRLKKPIQQIAESNGSGIGAEEALRIRAVIEASSLDEFDIETRLCDPLRPPPPPPPPPG